MLYVQYAGAPCEVFTDKNITISCKSRCKIWRVLPKSSPGRAVKPTARLLGERDQTVSYDYVWIRTRERPNEKERRTNCMIIFRRSP